MKGEDKGPSRLENFSAYRKALELFDLAVGDLVPLAKKLEAARLVPQKIASADSIASNIEEGYGRGGRAEYAQFLIDSRGSAQETAGRCLRLRHWLSEDVVEHRRQLCQEIIPHPFGNDPNLALRMISPSHSHLHSHSAARGDARRCAV